MFVYRKGFNFSTLRPVQLSAKSKSDMNKCKECSRDSRYEEDIFYLLILSEMSSLSLVTCRIAICPLAISKESYYFPPFWLFRPHCFHPQLSYISQ